MPIPPSSPKIHAELLERQAFIYVRQSTLLQVREHTASTARQYALVQRALDRGWPREHMIVSDQDQGRSGASAVERDGFQCLVAEVGLGHAGAVFCLEASRLARSCSDWYRLMEICGLTGTRVIDAEGIYDPRQYNDRLLLGFKGTRSEAELHWLRQRLLGGKLEKARHGQLRCRWPAGLVYDPTGAVVLDPDQQVQQVIRLVFSRFEQHGSALAVVKHFSAQGLLFPERRWAGAHDGELLWGPLHHTRVLSILHNPAYAGAYVYGRTQTRRHSLPGEAPRIPGRTRQSAPADWPIVLPDAHPAYLRWEQFLQHQQQLADTLTLDAQTHRGAVREGAALWQGLVLCGRGGRRMRVRYLVQGRPPSYACTQTHQDFAGPTCQSIRGDSVDAAVTHTFLAAIQPAPLEISLATLDPLAERTQQIERQWQLRLERAQYAADLARRRFLAVEPENRLVARSLERAWNEQLADCEHVQHAAAARLPLSACRLSAEERQRILALAQDLPALWQAPTTTFPERKQLLRFLIKAVCLSKRANQIHIAIRWQTDALSALDIARPPRACDACRTAPDVIARIQGLASDHTDRQIAQRLNQDHVCSGRHQPFSENTVQWIRYTYGIATACPAGPAACPQGQRGDGRYSVHAAAALLNVNVSTIADWCQTGVLNGLQAVPHGPRWIALTPEQITQLRKPVRQQWSKNLMSRIDKT